MEAEGNEQAGGFTIEITCNPDGTFAVSTESAAAEGAEQEGPEGQAGQVYKGVKECLTAVMEIMKTGSQADPMAEKQAMSAGFGA